MTWYYRYETKGIQRWILDSSRLRDLTGGSALVDKLSRDAQNSVSDSNGKVRFCAAGGLVATFESKDDLQKHASDWPMRVAYAAPGLQVVQAWVDADEHTDKPLEQLFEKLAARRNTPIAPLIEAGPWLERSGLTGNPAVSRPRNLPSSKARQTMWDEASVSREQARNDLKENEKVFGGTLSLDEISDDVERWPEVPIAVVHADGSGIGLRINALGGELSKLEEFSNALEKSTIEATRAALTILRERQNRKRLLFRPVVLGGDDLTAILPARDAVHFVIGWLREFEQQTHNRRDPLGGKGLHAGAGIAMVNRGYPFAMAYDLAEAACKAAKRDNLEKGSPCASAMRLRRVTTSLVTEEGKDASKGTTWRLDRVDGLIRLTQAVAALPRGTLRSWLTLVDDSRREERDALWRRAREVAGETAPDDWKALEAALKEVGASPETGLFSDGISTPLRDALVLTHLEKGAER